MSYYSRRQIVELLHVEETFVVTLEREEIIRCDAPADSAGEFSEQMLERVRVADTLVNELEVNLPGAAIIIRLREDMARMRSEVATLRREIERRFGRESG